MPDAVERNAMHDALLVFEREARGAVTDPKRRKRHDALLPGHPVKIANGETSRPERRIPFDPMEQAIERRHGDRVKEGGPLGETTRSYQVQPPDCRFWRALAIIASRHGGAMICDVNGIELYWEEAGDGEPLLWLHGMLGCGADWRRSLDRQID